MISRRHSDAGAPQTAASSPTIAIRVCPPSSDSVAFLGPRRCGVPFPRGLLTDPDRVRLRNSAGAATTPLQTRVLDRWSDGSIRWCLVEWFAAADDAAEYFLETAEPTMSSPAVAAVSLEEDLSCGGLRCRPGRPGDGVLFSLEPHEAAPAGKLSLSLTDEEKRPLRFSLQTMQPIAAGPVSRTWSWSGIAVGIADDVRLQIMGELRFYTATALVACSITLRNPRAARHPGGFWDLGDASSVHLREYSVRWETAEPMRKISAVAELGGATFVAGSTWHVAQESSGGECWNSTAHVNRRGEVPWRYRGYRGRCDDEEFSGLRALPTVALCDSRGPTVALSPHHFWQNFPMSIAADVSGITLGLFPTEAYESQELQGGEQKTHEFTLAFGPAAAELLHGSNRASICVADPAWIEASGAVPYLSARLSFNGETSPVSPHDALIDLALDPVVGFERKREVIDEYGWRHFGDIYGDHEAAFHKAGRPLVSHYNNQYDAVQGFAYQFLRTGDRRWFEQMEQLARHFIDIDTYHTNEDKSAYNGGQFWHTYHYIDAGTAHHRTYPRHGKCNGGGPSAEHCYVDGLLLFYFLTGDEAARRAAIEAARWIVNMDDGRRTKFRLVARSATGLASSSGNPDYHGPGRGPANAVAALLSGFRVSGDKTFLSKAEELIRRVTHPDDDLTRLNLLDVERRWYYTMYLQSLGKYLDLKCERDELDDMYAYGRAVLLHYARWMAQHEYPYLEKPEILEYPTETWAAQDIRKSDVFYFASRHADDAERQRFLERAKFFHRSSTSSLSDMPTKAFCRPVVLLLSNGLLNAYFVAHAVEHAPRPHGMAGRYPPTAFVPQKKLAKRRLKMLGGFLVVAFAALGLFFAF